MDCTEASAGIYESTRLGEQGSPGYIWQFTIRISITTKYTLIVMTNNGLNNELSGIVSSYQHNFEVF